MTDARPVLSDCVADLRALLRGAVRGARRDDALVVVSVPAGERAAEALLGDADDGVFWARPGGLVLAGAGSAASVEASGPDRLASVRRAAEALFARISLAALGSGAPLPRLVGGLSFHARAPGSPWQGFRAARFVLPRLCLVQSDGRRWLSLALGVDELSDPALRERALDELYRTSAPPAAGGRVSPAPAPIVDDAFERSVELALRAIERGRFDKVVVARAARRELAKDCDIPGLLARLAVRAPRCTRFAFVQGGAAFVGASPERLIERRGLDIASEALAGSARTGDPAALAALLASDKERAEHAIVADAIRRELAPLCTTLEAPSAPDVRALRHVAHLWTPIRGRLASARHVLELVELLHPTPAVGGQPRRAALDWLAEHEALERGWYAAPFGWFDRAGDGELCVALRSALITERTAHLFAGAGIVRGSQPAAELSETELKLRALSEVLEAAS